VTASRLTYVQRAQVHSCALIVCNDDDIVLTTISCCLPVRLPVCTALQVLDFSLCPAAFPFSPHLSKSKFHAWFQIVEQKRARRIRGDSCWSVKMHPVAIAMREELAEHARAHALSQIQADMTLN
jgi:hypothetical protein